LITAILSRNIQRFGATRLRIDTDPGRFLQELANDSPDLRESLPAKQTCAEVAFQAMPSKV
jgi:hypothetical protein